ncbi:hypothetical protein LIER_18530 [Lithospermum erythrorhizon]|uniref:Uncharacterized protein n=1 Tax=Lithospermum erythrorhizon TaxID=34254 RepID=A0AAV3QEA8_LITER
MADSSRPHSSCPSGPSEALQGTLKEVRIARRVAEVGGIYSFDDKTHFSLLSSPIVLYSNRRLVFLKVTSTLTITPHSPPILWRVYTANPRWLKPLTSLWAHFSEIVLKPQMMFLVRGPIPPTWMILKAPLDVEPLRSLMGPHANVPFARGQQVARPETSKGKGSKEPPSLDQVRAKTIPGLIIEIQLCAIRNHYDFPDEVKTRILDEEENINTPTTT